jgi:predicted amidohydrolase
MMRVAAIQLNASGPIAANLSRIDALVEQAADAGARLVVLPENCQRLSDHIGEGAEPIPGRISERLAALARRTGVVLHGGSIAEHAPDGRIFNTTLVFDPAGNEIARYRKLHLYDVQHAGGVYRESSVISPGTDLVVCPVDDFRVGLSICYDLRFPELYRSLTERGADVLVVPAAFTLHTGKDHWEVLLRARAIENLAYVIAADQYGSYGDGHQVFGNTLVADPWGTVIARAGDGEHIVYADLDRAAVEQARASIPALSHRHARLGGPLEALAGSIL